MCIHIYIYIHIYVWHVYVCDVECHVLCTLEASLVLNAVGSGNHTRREMRQIHEAHDGTRGHNTRDAAVRRLRKTCVMCIYIYIYIHIYITYIYIYVYMYTYNIN